MHIVMECFEVRLHCQEDVLLVTENPDHQRIHKIVYLTNKDSCELSLMEVQVLWHLNAG